MKLSDLDAVALNEACKRTYEYEWAHLQWEKAGEKEKGTYRKEIAATIIAYLTTLEKPADA